MKNEFLSMDGPGLLDENKVKELLGVAHGREVLQVDFEKDEVNLGNNETNKKALKFLRDLL